MRHLLILGFYISACIFLRAQEPQLTHSADGKLQQSRHDIYDSRNRLAVRIVYTYDDSTGAVETRTLTGYDRHGRVQRMEIYSADERLLFSDTYRYRRNGQLRRRIQRSYDDNGRLIDRTTIRP
ncbi:MAG: hypothetical protein AUK63_76 [bacterium P3]|nr:MAG: hypothetical protein AUK63_76 [bacterium P3]KWW42461.1 MAG: hypothetical protein F083_365 [bacterium F083]